MEATKQFECTAEELEKAWREAKVEKFGGGFYCGLMEMKDKKLYVFNAFFMCTYAMANPSAFLISFNSFPLCWMYPHLFFVLFFF